MSQFLGMDPAAVDAKAKQLSAKARDIETIQAQLTTLINSLDSVWHGKDMQKFKSDFNSDYRPVLGLIADGLESLSQKARANANQQRQTSAS